MAMQLQVLVDAWFNDDVMSYGAQAIGRVVVAESGRDTEGYFLAVKKKSSRDTGRWFLRRTVTCDSHQMLVEYDQIDPTILSAPLRRSVAGDGMVLRISRGREPFGRKMMALNQ